MHVLGTECPRNRMFGISWHHASLNSASADTLSPSFWHERFAACGKDSLILLSKSIGLQTLLCDCANSWLMAARLSVDVNSSVVGIPFSLFQRLHKCRTMLVEVNGSCLNLNQKHINPKQMNRKTFLIKNEKRSGAPKLRSLWPELRSTNFVPWPGPTTVRLVD